MNRLLAAWRLPLRLARRDAARSRARSTLVLVMIMLPVLAVTAAAVVARTTDVSAAEGLDRRLGSAQALLSLSEGSGAVEQGVDPDSAPYSTATGDGSESPAEVRRLLGDAPATSYARSSARLPTTDGVASIETTELDLGDPLTRGLFDLTSGRWPRSADEVVVNQQVLDRGYAVGDTLDLIGDDAPAPTIVGVAESTTLRSAPVAAGPAGSLGIDTPGYEQLLVGGGPVTWDDVRELNRAGALVYSRAVVLDPPSRSQLPASLRGTGSGPDPATVAVLGLVAAMVLLEVVLLAGPAFAVGARHQARSLALLVASGGTPTQARRVVLATAVVLGGVASAVGALLGVATGAALVPLAQRLSDTWLGPLDVPWLHVAVVAALGLVSALLAAAVPAVLASRQDVVAVLAGRRGEPRPSRRSPVLGLLLLAGGVTSGVLGATGRGGPLAIALSGTLSVIGTVLLVPLVLALLGRAARRLPLVLRYAVRDAARQRTRTAPAVAAVAATVAAVVTLGIGTSSDEAASRATYQPSLPIGTAAITAGYPLEGESVVPDWAAVTDRLASVAPDAGTTEVRGVRYAADATGAVDTYAEVRGPDGDPPTASYSGSLGSDVLVADRADRLLAGLPRGERDRADAALASGRAVVPTEDRSLLDADGATLLVSTYDSETETNDEQRRPLPATYVAVDGDAAPLPAAVLPTSLATAVGRTVSLPVAQVGLLVEGTTLDADQERVLTEAAGAAGDLGVYVERGYVADDATTIVLLVLGVLGAVLVLGGTLTATFLSLSDARPDLATLAAVGASPGTRRGVAASYALVVGGVGAVLGAVVGFVPGLAVAHVLTDGASGNGATGPFVDVPWLLVLGLVVVLPLLTATVVAGATRSRLPLVARAA